MWLLPGLTQLSNAAIRLFYRLTIAGNIPSKNGPILLVANHPNALLDPAMVAVAAQRPVRFLAKSPLFTDPFLGWLVRGVGAIPVYRERDNPGSVNRNTEMFEAALDALANGSAICIFPEGVSHHNPAIVPLKTGAARIALKAASRTGGAFPIVPIGITLRTKWIFRSEAMVVVGEPVIWDDLTASAPEGGAAVHELTERIERGIRAVTVNLERWEDAPMLECAEAVYAAELGGDPAPVERLRRLRGSVRVLRRLRRTGDRQWEGVAADLQSHAAILRRLGLTPADLHETPTALTAIRWTARRVPLLLAVLTGVTVVGTAIFWVPYRLTGSISTWDVTDLDVISTHKVLKGAVIFLIWIVLLVAGTEALAGGWAAAAALVTLPVLALTTLGLLERWHEARRDIRRFFVLRRRGDEMLPELRRQQRDLAERLEALRLAMTA